MPLFRAVKAWRNYMAGSRIGSTKKAAPAGASTPGIRGLTPTEEGLMSIILRSRRDTPETR